MNFKKAFAKMQEDGYKMKRPTWGGFWAWDSVNNTILMHTKEGDCMDIRETIIPAYTIDCILSDDWIEATSDNCKLLGGSPEFSFNYASKWLEAGKTLMRKSKPDVLYTKNSIFSLEDFKATDWMFND